MDAVRIILLFGSNFEEFYNRQSNEARRKIDHVLKLIAHIEKVPKKFLKYVESTDGLYEIRISFGNATLRIFCFFDSERKLILLNGVVKKKEKLPKNELVLAEKCKKEYFNQKSTGA